MTQPASEETGRNDPPTQPVSILTPRAWRQPWKPRWLEAYARNQNKAACCRVAGVSVSNLYWAMDHDPMFAEAIREAEQISIDLVRQVAHQSAVTGIPRTRTVRRIKRNSAGEVLEDETVETNDVIYDHRMRLRWLEVHAPEFRPLNAPIQVVADRPVEIYRYNDRERQLEVARLMVEQAEREHREYPDIEARQLPPAEEDE